MFLADRDETICALSSGALPCGVAVIRISGARSRFVLETMAGPVPVARRASLRRVRHPESAEVLDQALVLWLPGPATVTGEDMAELHLHGGRAVVAVVLRALTGLAGVRLAEPGEFTRRAFTHGRMDLTEVEGFADLLAAETEAQRRQALRQAEGGLGRRLQDWRQRLVRARAWIEAEFDFTDEADVPDGIAARTWEEVAALAAAMEREIDASRAAERIRRGVVVAVLGPPNAGKSSLVNALARRDVAIVSPEAGTTRDAIEVDLDLNGVPVRLIDTAGLREAAGSIEAEGIRRALARAESADLVLWLKPVTALAEAAPTLGSGVPVWRIASRADEAAASVDSDALRLSVRSGEGLDELVARLAVFAGGSTGEAVGLMTRERHVAAVTRAVALLREACERHDVPLELRSELLRQAGDEVARVTGAIGTEDLLDVIFREFCIGK